MESGPLQLWVSTNGENHLWRPERPGSRELPALSCMGSLAGEHPTMKESAHDEIKVEQNIPAEDEQSPPKQNYEHGKVTYNFKMFRDTKTIYKTWGEKMNTEFKNLRNEVRELGAGGGEELKENHFRSKN